MFTILLFAVVTAMVVVLVLLAVVVVGIRQEPPTAELSSQAPARTAALVRRLLGLYVRKPDPPLLPDEQPGELYLTTRGPSHRAEGDTR